MKVQKDSLRAGFFGKFQYFVKISSFSNELYNQTKSHRKTIKLCSRIAIKNTSKNYAIKWFTY